MSDIKKLREMTGAGLADCKKALAESEDMDGAVAYLRKKGQAVAAKRSDREASEGCVLVKAENGFGAIIALTPGIGVVKWNDVDIPWHLMIFSAGAYVIGSGLNATDLPSMLVGAGMDALGITAQTPFIVLYILLTGLMLFSALVFQSKNMRALVFIPIAIGVEQQFGLPPLSLSFPVSLLIEHVYVLPFNSKPAALLYTTNHYSWSDTFKFGITMMLIAWVMILVWGETVLHWLGYTPGLF